MQNQQIVSNCKNCGANSWSQVHRHLKQCDYCKTTIEVGNNVSPFFAFNQTGQVVGRQVNISGSVRNTQIITGDWNNI